MTIVAPVARETFLTTCRAVTTVGGLCVSPGIVFLGVAALGVVGFLAYQALRNDYEVTIEAAGVGPLTLKGVHLVKAGGPSTGAMPRP
jgi:hypothetical protein